MRDYIAIANQYIDDVLTGKRAANKWEKKAAGRQKKDLKRKRFAYSFDESRAIRICKFIELLPHIKGRWAGAPLTLEPWQVFILTTVFGWVDKHGYRRFKIVYIEVPRKNAKSTLTSGVALYMLSADAEGGAECYSAATTRDQARIVFDDSRRMAEKTRGLSKRFGVDTSAHSVYVEDSASFLKPLSAEGSTLDGLNIHFASVDELHAHKTRDVWDVLETGTGARTQPLLWAITTAGSNRAGVCYEQRTYLTKILNSVHKDETYFGIIYTIDDSDDWTNPDAWIKANPNYNVSVNPEDIARLCVKAQQMPSAQNNFLTKRLNVWVNADTSWMDMRKWDMCRDENLELSDFEGMPCYAALDLASKIDIAAKVLLFKREDHYYVFGKYYLPEETIDSAGNSQYHGWAIEGRLESTPGNVIDYEYIKDDLRNDASRFQIEEVGYDPFQATQLSTELMNEGFQMVEMRPTVLNFSEPMKELEKLVLSKKIHFNDPVLTWMVSNVVAHLDNKDNIYPKKERVENKIDGVVALIMALGRCMMGSPEDNSPQVLVL